MIESSFCFLSGVGWRTERQRWQRAVGSWVDFLSSHSIPGIGARRKALSDGALGHAKERRSQKMRGISPSTYMLPIRGVCMNGSALGPCTSTWKRIRSDRLLSWACMGRDNVLLSSEGSH